MADTSGEPKPIIPALAPFYEKSRDLAWLVVRCTAGGILLVHGLDKVINRTVAGFLRQPRASRHRARAAARLYGVLPGDRRRSLYHPRAVHAILRRGDWHPVSVDHLRPLGAGLRLEPAGRRMGVPAVLGIDLAGDRVRGGGPYSLDRKLGREL
jgi:hypothetical protein